MLNLALGNAHRRRDGSREHLLHYFPLSVFAHHGDEVCEVLDWFVGVAALDLARRG
ncbi:hypothetical protein [Streptomyces sp. NPDC051636]|uniref:hypothetical protein n=1 Tax=Streptomyces sp. NPDC051636 TaxID=3365663 RepID=UPI0037A34747